ncbi:hypothetical protein [Trinickia sp. LjRoot230]|uniref:hypothetical protein n=1 Tax=Trinickia sp. LjRoot230 TaxID=3342288 RepID=UPI003F50D115
MEWPFRADVPLGIAIFARRSASAERNLEKYGGPETISRYSHRCLCGGKLGNSRLIGVHVELAIVCVVKNGIPGAKETLHRMPRETCCGDAKASVIECARFVQSVKGV